MSFFASLNNDEIFNRVKTYIDKYSIPSIEYYNINDYYTILNDLNQKEIDEEEDVEQFTGLIEKKEDNLDENNDEEEEKEEEVKEEEENNKKNKIDNNELLIKNFIPVITIDLNNKKLKKILKKNQTIEYNGKIKKVLKSKDYIIIITYDYISSFDKRLDFIPSKGKILNLLNIFWLKYIENNLKIPTYYLSSNHSNILYGIPCKIFPVEFIVRGYMTGSTKTSIWYNYNTLGCRNYCGIELEDNIKKNQKLKQILLTPTTKNFKKNGNDELISKETIINEKIMSLEDYETCEKYALKIFTECSKFLESKNIILVDTKYEFGIDCNGTIRLIDEVHTPDSSRYWLKNSYEEKFLNGEEPENFDKEFIRAWYKKQCDPYKKGEILPKLNQDLKDELFIK